MIEIAVIGKIAGEAFKVVSETLKLGQHHKDKKEEERMREIVDDLRRRSYANAGNCLKAEIGSEQDRFYGKMVVKGYLVRVPFGYMLPELFQHSGRSLY